MKITQFTHGWCDTCQVRFTPQPWATKQYYCQKCRSTSVDIGCGSNIMALSRQDDLLLKPGFMKHFLQEGESFRAFIKRKKMSIAASTLHSWNVIGRVPARTGAVRKLCKAVKMSKTELEQRFGR